MSNQAKVTLVTVEGDGIQFRAEAKGQSIVTDSGRERVAPSPVDLLLFSLGACQAMDVIDILRKKRQRVTAYEVDLSGERRTDHPRAFTKIDVVHRVTGHEVSRRAVEHAVELSHTKYCSVTASLDPKIQITSRVEIVAA